MPHKANKALLHYMYRPNLVESSPYGPNLLTNPGFEIAGSGQLFADWSQNSGTTTVTDETSDVHSGGHAAKISATSGTPFYRQVVVVEPSVTYYLSFWCHRAAGDSFRPRYRIYDATHSAYIVAVTATDVTATTYTFFSTTFVTPAGCVSIRLELLASSTSTDTSWFDDVELKKVL